MSTPTTQIDMNKKKQRTIKQNRALHLYFTLVANALNNAGLDMKAVLKPDIEIPWSPETVKDFLWKPVQRIQVDKAHTADLTTDEIDKVFDTMNRHLAKHGIQEPFPSIEEIINRQRNENIDRPRFHQK